MLTLSVAVALDVSGVVERCAFHSFRLFLPRVEAALPLWGLASCLETSKNLS
jgi:hypothetical protein